jgi:hypothetical protein
MRHKTFVILLAVALGSSTYAQAPKNNSRSPKAFTGQPWQVWQQFNTFSEGKEDVPWEDFPTEKAAQEVADQLNDGRTGKEVGAFTFVVRPRKADGDGCPGIPAPASSKLGGTTKSSEKKDRPPTVDTEYDPDKEKAYKPTGRQRVGIYNPNTGTFEYRYYDDDGKLIEEDPPAKGVRSVVPCKDLGDQIDLDHRRLMKMLDESGKLVRALEQATKRLEEQNARVDEARETYEEVNELVENYTNGIDDIYIAAVNRRTSLRDAWDRESAKANQLAETVKRNLQAVNEFSAKYESQSDMQDTNYKIWKKIKGIKD